MDIAGKINFLDNTLFGDLHTGDASDEDARSDQYQAG